ncbi:MAG: acyl-CoA dehydrogenase family protein [Deltaproteobacteria bacterium]|nr:acyl-CoA dehydrogenase family protein [Deltaproteobacteria bacterium]
MAIDFEHHPVVAQTAMMIQQLAQNVMRPAAREVDEHEHTDPTAYIHFMWDVMKSGAGGQAATQFTGGPKKKDVDPNAPRKPGYGNVLGAVSIEMMSWGDAGIYLATPVAGLGGAAVAAAGTDEQKEKFLKRFSEGDKPTWGAMAITEPGCGSDSAAITTTAHLDGDHWVLNGHKIYVTSGKRAIIDSNGFVVVWATVDKSAGRAGIKSFVVEAGTPGMTLLSLEKKHGIRASDTAQIVFENCRVPRSNLLGSEEIDRNKGFKGVMATFDATRPAVAASAIGIGRAALEFVQERFAEAGIKPSYGKAANELTARERDLMEMEANLKAAWLLTLKAAWMSDNKLHNNLEASICKAKAGLAVTQLTQKAVELMGPLGYSREILLEKWMRDAKINDIFEGTQQINMLIIARRVLGYSRDQLK